MDFDQEQHFREAWEAVRIARNPPYTLFTFGESVLPYCLVCGASESGATVTVARGDVRIARPMILTPYDVDPEFRNFFDDPEGNQMIDFLLARTAAFSNLKLNNQSGPARIVSDSVEEAVAKLTRHLDEQDEDRVAILTAPPELGGMAVLRYTADRVMASAPGNIQELRERGFLP